MDSGNENRSAWSPPETMTEAGILRDQWLGICHNLFWFCSTVDDIRFTITDQIDLQAGQIILQGQTCHLVGDQQDPECHHAADLDKIIRFILIRSILSTQSYDFLKPAISRYFQGVDRWVKG